MITNLLNFPGQCVYTQVKKAQTKNELTVIALALATFSAITSYYIPLSYTFSHISAFILYAGQFNAVKREVRKMSDPLYDRIFSISLTVIVGGEIGQKLRESYPIEAPWPWYSATWKTPFHIINNALVYVIFPFHLKDIVDANSLKNALLIPGKTLLNYSNSLQSPQEIKVTLAASFALSALAAYWSSLFYTFSTATIITLYCGAISAIDEATSENAIPIISASLYLFLLGSKVGNVIESFHFPSPDPWYSVSRKTPLHIMNNLTLIGIPVLSILAVLVDSSDPRPPLPAIHHEPEIIDKTKALNPLMSRINHLGKFELNASIRSDDDIRAAHFVLNSDPTWSREGIRNNYRILVFLTHTDRNPDLDRKYNQYVTEAAKVLGAN